MAFVQFCILCLFRLTSEEEAYLHLLHLLRRYTRLVFGSFCTKKKKNSFFEFILFSSQIVYKVVIFFSQKGLKGPVFSKKKLVSETLKFIPAQNLNLREFQGLPSGCHHLQLIACVIHAPDFSSLF